jgi:asparagine synthase (glutamine-hydrolysing)
MCGIFAIIDFDKAIDVKDSDFKNALMKMVHRGPDNQSIVQVNKHCVLGHVRLSIIDLESQSNQPFVDASKRYHLVYNGEIYNYLEIRDELIKLGCTFHTQSDTEVLLQAFITWGDQCVQRFNGMWAFVIYDSEKSTVFCSRDRFGVKPFYYAQIGSRFVISSSVKSIIAIYPELRFPNYSFIGEYCRFSIGAQFEETWFKDIHRLAPSHNLTISVGGQQFNQYWDYPVVEKRGKFNANKIIADYKTLFFDAVKLRYRSDVPVGITLSSGLDSNSILYCTNTNKRKELTAYSIGADKQNYSKQENTWLSDASKIKDESEIARNMAADAQVDFERVDYQSNSYVDQLKRIVYFLESGHQSSPIVPYNQLIQQVAKRKTVILEGQGADELLGGYVNSTIFQYVFELIGKGRFVKACRLVFKYSKHYSLFHALKVFLGTLNLNKLRMVYNYISGIEGLYRKPLKSKKRYSLRLKRRNGEGFLNFKLRESHRGTLVNLLHYGDAISMTHSVESRLPFMDYRLVEFVFKLPSEFKIRDGLGKVLHRDAMRGILPDLILDDHVKMGFNTPLLGIFLQTGPDSPRAILLSERCLNRGLFNGKALSKVFDKLSKDSSLLPMIYRMLTVELWFRLFIDGDEIDGLKV